MRRDKTSMYLLGGHNSTRKWHYGKRNGLRAMVVVKCVSGLRCTLVK